MSLVSTYFYQIGIGITLCFFEIRCRKHAEIWQSVLRNLKMMRCALQTILLPWKLRLSQCNVHKKANSTDYNIL